MKHSIALKKKACAYGYCDLVATPDADKLNAWITRYVDSMDKTDSVAALVMLHGVVNHYALELAKRDMKETKQ